MLLPALTQARNQAKNILCVNNLKQLGLVHSHYVEDFDGHFVNPYKGVGTWILDPYIPNTKIMECPMHAVTDRQGDYPGFYTWTTMATYSYAINAYVEGHGYQPKFNHPSGTMVNIDTDCHHWVSPGGALPWIRARHFRKANYLCADSHVTAKAMSEIPTSYKDPFWAPHKWW